MSSKSPEIVIIGAGPIGLVTALFLSQRGYVVHVFEGRSDPRLAAANSGRSISFTITSRGWRTLRRAGVEELVRRLAIPLRGRMIHDESGALRFQSYGMQGEAIDSVARTELVWALLDEVEKQPRAKINFNHRCLDLDAETGEILFQTTLHGLKTVSAERILATDGANSAVRLSFAKQPDFALESTYSHHFYRELSVPAGPDGSFVFESNMLHLWPRGELMVVAFPHLQRGFTATIFMPLAGPASFERLSTPDRLKSFFRETLGDLLPRVTRLVPDFFGAAPSSLVAIRCSPWTACGRVALIGDAAHAMYPFLGQGLNAGLEDIGTLIDQLNGENDRWDVSIANYAALRKPNTDAITSLAALHYDELAEQARDPRFILRKRVEARLTLLMPNELMSPYHAIAFSDRPYTEAQAIAKLQRRVVDRVVEVPGLEERWGTPELDDEIRALARMLSAQEAA